MILAKASLNFDPSFIVLATVIMIVNYNRKTFIVHATGLANLPVPVKSAFFLLNIYCNVSNEMEPAYCQGKLSNP